MTEVQTRGRRRAAAVRAVLAAVLAVGLGAGWVVGSAALTHSSTTRDVAHDGTIISQN